MGQQQLMFVLLGVIIVGIAIAAGLTIFSGGATEATRNVIIVDLGYFAQKAREYYWKPTSLGGGNKSFVGVTMQHVSQVSENEHARYYIEEATADYVTFMGVGKIIAGSDSIRVRMRADEKKNTLEIIN